MIDFYSLLELSQLKAIHAALEPSIDSVYRMKCREYSIKFNTPLHIVVNELDPLFILQALYEEQYTPSIIEEEIEEILDRLYTIKDPTYSRMSKEETESLVDAVLNKEISRLSKKKSPTQETIQSEIKSAEVEKLNKPKSGGLNFSDLERLESKSENNTKGF